MAGFADLVPQAQPALFGGGLAASGTVGRTWLWPFVDVTDSAGDPIDLTAVTGVCKVVSGPGGGDVVTLSFVGGVGEFSVGLAKAATAAINTTGVLHWYLTLDDGTDSVQVWAAVDSKFTIRTGI